MAPYGSGIVTDSYDDKAFEWMGWYAAAGRRVRTSYRDVRMAWSWARGEVTWYDLHRRRAVEASTETGQVLHRFGAPPHLAFPEPVGWLGADDVLFALNATASHPRSWRTSSSRVQPDPATVLAATAAGRLVAGVGGGGQGSDPSCVLAWRADRPESPLWRDCLRVDGATFGAFDAGGAAFSPDGRLLVVGVRGTVGKGAPSAVAVLDARRGTVVGELAEGDYLRSAEAPEHQVTRVAFEDHTHLLLAVSDSTYGTGRRPFAALVRCELTSVTCRLATAPKPWTPGRVRPYGIVGRGACAKMGIHV